MSFTECLFLLYFTQDCKAMISQTATKTLDQLFCIHHFETTFQLVAPIRLECSRPLQSVKAGGSTTQIRKGSLDGLVEDEKVKAFCCLF